MVVAMPDALGEATGAIGLETLPHDGEAREDHQPSSGPGAELFLVFDADGDRWLDNHRADGTTIHFGMPFFKAFERIALEDAEKLDLAKLVDVTPGGGR